MPSKSARARRSVYLGFAVVLLMLGLRPATPLAQQGVSQGPFFVAGRNVNTVGAPPASGSSTDFIGDPLFKQQNEVDCDVSPNDSRLVFCANNDYRGIEAFGDSWIGVTMSDDGGLTWKSRLHPGFPATKGTQVGAADPVVAAVPGLGLVGFITISRTDGRGTLSLGRWAERNKENGDRYTFLDNVVIGSGTPGRFADKPAMVAVLTSAGLGGAVTTVGDRAVPTGVIHFGYAIFPGNANNSSSEIYHLMSTDYGRTWSNPKKLSESVGINQGIDFAVGGNTVVATWRRIKDNNEPDAIMFARSTDGGKTWSKASVLSLGTFFDQDSSDLQFRTRSMPSIVHDGTAFHVFWSARGMNPPTDPRYVDARVVVSNSADGIGWTAPVAVDNHARRGHQLMPTAAVAGGRVQVNWIDSRSNRDDSFGPTLSDSVYDDPLSEKSGKSVYRQAVDVFAAQAPSGVEPGFGAAQQVSRYRGGFVTVPGTTRRLPAQFEYNFINARMFKQGVWPFHGDYHSVAGQRYRPNPATPGGWIANTQAEDSHAVFYSAFTDNRDVRGYVWAGPTNTSFTGVGMQGESGGEVPGPVACSAGPLDPLADYLWTPDNSPRSRDQNIYAAATLPGLLVESPSGSKPTGSLQRAYVVTVHNLTPQKRDYSLTIANQPPGSTSVPGFALWTRCEAGSCVPSAAPVLQTSIEGRSSISRTVYVSSSEARPRVAVNVAEVGGLGQTGSVILNVNLAGGEIDQPDGGLADILTQEVYQPDIPGRQTTSYITSLANPEVVPVSELMTPRIEYPRIEYPRIEYPRIEYDPLGNPRIEYPRIEYPRIEYDPLGNPRIEYPRIEYPRIEYKAIENPRIEYSALTGDTVQVTEITWPVTTAGANTTTAMTAKVFVNGGLPAGVSAQVLVTVPYQTGVANSCAPGDTGPIVDNQVIVNSIVNPADLAATLVPPDVVNPPSWQPSFPVKPGQTVWVTLRLTGLTEETGKLVGKRTGVWVRSQPDTVANNALDEARDGVIDFTAPVFSTTPGTVLGRGRATGPDGGVVDYVLPSASDAVDSAPVVSCSPVTGSSFKMGDSIVACTATDASLNSTSADFRVQVIDETAPVLNLGGIGSELKVEGNATGGANVTYTVTAKDAVEGDLVVACSRPSGFFPLGTIPVTCSATDSAGNTASAGFDVTVVDTTRPTVTVPAGIPAKEATGPRGAVVEFSVTASDIVDIAPVVTCAPTSGSTFPVGMTTVTCTAKDATGNVSAPSSFTVTVRDVTPPTVVAPPAVTAEATGSQTVVVIGTATATDTVGVVSLTSNAPATFSVGTTIVTWTATDAAGNKGTATQTVTVGDTTPPTVTAPANVTAEATGLQTAVVIGTATATDAVGVISLTSDAPTAFPLGTTIVTWTATDAAGNRGTATQQVSVVDTKPPVILEAATPTVLIWSPNKIMTPVRVYGSITDATTVTATYTVVDEYKTYNSSGPIALVINQDGSYSYSFTVSLEAWRAGTDSDGRTYTITVTAKDIKGNPATKSVVVRVPHNS